MRRALGQAEMEAAHYAACVLHLMACLSPPTPRRAVSEIEGHAGLPPEERAAKVEQGLRRYNHGMRVLNAYDLTYVERGARPLDAIRQAPASLLADAVGLLVVWTGYIGGASTFRVAVFTPRREQHELAESEALGWWS